MPSPKNEGSHSKTEWEARQHKQSPHVVYTFLPSLPPPLRSHLQEEAIARTKAGEKVILAREETCPDDIEGMNIAQGIVTGPPSS